MSPAIKISRPESPYACDRQGFAECRSGSRDLLGSAVRTSGSHPAQSAGAAGRPLGSAAGEARWEGGLAHKQTGRVPHRDARRVGRGGDAVWAGQRARGARPGGRAPVSVLGAAPGACGKVGAGNEGCVSAYLFIHVCVHLYTYVCAHDMCVSMHVYMYVCVFMRVFTCVHVCMYMCVCVWYACVYDCICAWYACVYVCLYVCLCMCVYICACVHV